MLVHVSLYVVRVSYVRVDSNGVFIEFLYNYILVCVSLINQQVSSNVCGRIQVDVYIMGGIYEWIVCFGLEHLRVIL